METFHQVLYSWLIVHDFRCHFVFCGVWQHRVSELSCDELQTSLKDLQYFKFGKKL